MKLIQGFSHLVFHEQDRITNQGLGIIVTEGILRLCRVEDLQISFPKIFKDTPDFQDFLKVLGYFGFPESANFV